MGRSWWGDQLFATHCCEPKLPYSPPLPGPASTPDITLLSGRLLLDVMWTTLTTFGSNPLPITVSLSSYASPSPRKARSYTKFCKADWEVFTAESERRFAETPLPNSYSAREKVFRRNLIDAGRHHISSGYFGLLQPSPRCCATTHHEERSAAHLWPLRARHQAAGPWHPAAHSPGSSRPVGGSSWSSPTAPLIPSATGLFCAS